MFFIATLRGCYNAYFSSFESFARSCSKNFGVVSRKKIERVGAACCRLRSTSDRRCGAHSRARGARKHRDAAAAVAANDIKKPVANEAHADSGRRARARLRSRRLRSRRVLVLRPRFVGTLAAARGVDRPTCVRRFSASAPPLYS